MAVPGQRGGADAKGGVEAERAERGGGRELVQAFNRDRRNQAFVRFERGDRGAEVRCRGREGLRVLMLQTADEVDLGQGLGDGGRVGGVGEVGGGVDGAGDEGRPECAADLALAEAREVDVGFHGAVAEFGEEGW